MLRALLWKEWRAQRPIAVAGMGLSLVVPVFVVATAFLSGAANYRVDAADLIPFVMAGLVWPLFAAMAGAASNAAESGVDPYGFLFSRPVPRYRIWAVKVATATLCLATVVAASFAVVNVIQTWAGLEWLRFPFSSDPFGMRPLSLEAARVAVLGFVFLAFALAIFFAMLTRRQVMAAGAGALTAVAAVALVVFASSRLSADPDRTDGSEAFLLSVFLLVTGAVLLGALYLFVAGSTLEGADKRRSLAVVIVGIALAAVSATVVSAAVTTRIDPASADFSLTSPVPSAGHFLVAAGHSRFGGTAYFVAAPGEPLLRLTDRMAEGARVSPTGEWVVYRDHRGLLGFRRSDCDLRAVRGDGTDDHLITRLDPCAPFVVFSEDGSKVAYGPTPLSNGPQPNGLGLTVASLDGESDQRTLRFADNDDTAGRPRRWIDGDTRIVIVGSAISVLDLATGQIEVVYGDDEGPRFWLRGTYGSRMLVRERVASLRTGATEFERATIARRSTAEESDRLIWVDASDGGVEEVDWPCRDFDHLWRLSPDGRFLLYAGCERRDEPSAEQPDAEQRESSRSALAVIGATDELWIRHLESGEETLMGTFEGEILSVLPSPGQMRFRVRTYVASRRGWRERDFIVERNGVTRELELPRHWRPSWWWDDQRVVAYRGSRQSGYRYGIYDLETGRVQDVVGSE